MPSGFVIANKIVLSGTTSGGLVEYASAPVGAGEIVQLLGRVEKTDVNKGLIRIDVTQGFSKNS